MTLNNVVRAGGPTGPPGGVDCTANPDDPACSMPLDTNVIILVAVGIAIGAIMLRKKLNTASFHS